MIRRVLLLSASLLMTMLGGLSVAHAATINVTTLQDEDGENPASCSLREAIKASATKAAYGGCNAGQQYYTDTIQLTAGTYKLTKGELVVGGDMVIVGGNTVDALAIDPITGLSPKRTPIVTTIVATGGSRIFNTSKSHNQVNLSSIILNGGTADFGGSIRAGGLVFLSRVQINNATASEQGGAVYLEGPQATMTAVSTSFTGSNAKSGAVLGMSCFDNLNPTVRTLTLSQISVTGNGKGASGTSSILDLCGEITTNITASTISSNAAQVADSSDLILAPAIVRIAGNINTRLGRKSTLNLTSNTLVENNANTVLAYSTDSGLTLINNILAFNTSTSDCEYRGSNSANASTSASFNLFSSVDGTVATSKCHLYPGTISGDTNIYSNNTVSLSDILSPLGLYGGSDLLGYLPKITNPITSSPIIHKGASTQDCGSTDQRGLTRGSGIKRTTNLSDVVNCDIGALEVSILTANDDQNGLNVSYDIVVNTIANTTGLTESQAKILAANNTKYLDAYKSSYRYREVVMDVTVNDSAQEVVSGNSSTIDLLTDSTKYTITGSDNGNVHCEWNPVMKQMLASRTDGTTTPGGDIDSCTYSIKDLSAGGATKTAKLEFKVTNISPIAKNDAFTLSFGTKSIPLNILANDSDDGDGPVGSTNYPAGKTPFYADKRLVNGVVVSIPANVRFVTKPALGHIVAQYEQPCPDNNVNTTATTCYGGTMTYVNDNLFSPFNDSFTYQVLDSDLTPSNIATVTVTNTATTTDIKKAGGGSLGLGALLGLVSLVFIRRRMVHSYR
ncbi:MAG: CSLREA domain-containing protein [Aquirhabdus sp.]